MFNLTGQMDRCWPVSLEDMPKSVQELVHEQVAAKIAAGEELERKVAEVTERAADLAAAEKGAATARRAALGAGWTETELKSLGSRSGRARDVARGGSCCCAD